MYELVALQLLEKFQSITVDIFIVRYLLNLASYYHDLQVNIYEYLEF